MSIDVMAERYSASDAAYALGHGNFGDYQRNLRKGGFLVLPRETSPGPGSEFYYGHLVELAINMHVGSAFSRDIGKAVAMGLWSLLGDNHHALKKVNNLSDEDRQALYAAGGDDMEGGSEQYVWLVKFPHLYLDSDHISRDASDPTFAVFNPLKVFPMLDIALIKGTASLAEAYAKVVALSTAAAGSEEYRREMEDRSHVPGVVNLTSLLNRLDERLAIRIRARAPLGQRKPLGA